MLLLLDHHGHRLRSIDLEVEQRMAVGRGRCGSCARRPGTDAPRRRRCTALRARSRHGEAAGSRAIRTRSAGRLSTRHEPGPLTGEDREHPPGKTRPVRLRRMAGDHRIPKGRVRRSAKLGTALGMQATRYAGTKTANVARSAESAEERIEARHLETALKIASTLGEMKGAAMKLGQLASFVDTEFLPDEYREIYQEQLAQAAHLGAGDALGEGREGARVRVPRASGSTSSSRTSSARRSPPPRSVRCTARRCTMVARWPSRSSTRASPRRSSPTFRTWG